MDREIHGPPDVIGLKCPSALASRDNGRDHGPIELWFSRILRDMDGYTDMSSCYL